MNNLVKLTVLGSALLLNACASGGSMSDKASAANLSVVEKITINAPAEKVWAKAGNYGDLGAFHPAVAKTEITNGTNNTKGAVRLLTLGDGGTVNETLTSYDAAGMSYAYVINESVLPVSNYSAKIMVKPVSANVSEVVWNANFKRKDLSVTPAKGQNDEAATGTIHAVFKGGLENLKKISETIKNSTEELVFSMELKGKAASVAGKENTLEANTTGRGHWNEVVTFKSQVVLNGSALDEFGTIDYHGHGKLTFKTIGSGHIAPSSMTGLLAGVVTWQITEGEGRFAGATGYITSNFTVSAEGNVVDNHYVRVFLKQ